MPDIDAPETGASVVYVAPALLPVNSANDLADALTQAGLVSSAQMHEALGVRGTADEIWIALSANGADILLGAAGAAVWDGVLAAFRRLLRPKGGKCRVVLQYKDESVSADVDLSGSPAEIANVLRELPDVLRGKTMPAS